MPVRLLNSPVLKWPNARTVIQALHRWAARVTQNRADVVRIGYFGSYARGDWGVGSDLDLIIILMGSDKPFEMRGSEFDTLEIPVPTDILVYSREEWETMTCKRRFSETLEDETIWIYAGTSLNRDNS